MNSSRVHTQFPSCFDKQVSECDVTGTDLPGGSVVSEVEKHGGEPSVDLIQGALFVWRLQDGLRTDTRQLSHSRIPG